MDCRLRRRITDVRNRQCKQEDKDAHPQHKAQGSIQTPNGLVDGLGGIQRFPLVFDHCCQEVKLLVWCVCQFKISASVGVPAAVRCCPNWAVRHWRFMVDCLWFPSSSGMMTRNTVRSHS